MLEKCEIRFLPFDGRRVAYEMRGDGPPLVAPAWWVSHLELDWQSTGFRRFWQEVADGYTLVRYDRLGVGMSDRTGPDSDLTLDQEVATLRALLDELDLERVSLIGGSSGSCTAVAFAAAYPSASSTWCSTGRTPTAPRSRRRAWATPSWRRYARTGAWARGCSVTSSSGEPTRRSRSTSHGSSGRRRTPRPPLPYWVSSIASTYARSYPSFAPRRWSCIDAAIVRCHTGSGVKSPQRFQARRSSRCTAARTSPGTAMSIPSCARAARCSLRCSRHRTRSSQPDSVTLSEREREILACVARGLSDREIAGQLVLSPHTVHRHVANIRRKLARTSRTAAVAEAARLGLL